MTPEKYREYCEKMEKLSESTDYECSHGMADDLLVEYIKEISPHSDRFLEAYDKLVKWYA